MYPVDLMKVRKPRPGVHMSNCLTHMLADPDADHQSYLRQYLHRHLECSFDNIQTRRLANIMAGNDQCHCRSRYELDAGRRKRRS